MCMRKRVCDTKRRRTEVTQFPANQTCPSQILFLISNTDSGISYYIQIKIQIQIPALVIQTRVELIRRGARPAQTCVRLAEGLRPKEPLARGRRAQPRRRTSGAGLAEGVPIRGRPLPSAAVRGHPQPTKAATRLRSAACRQLTAACRGRHQWYG